MSVKKYDVLFKGILEDFFADFLRIIFPDADEIFDFSKGFSFLEQELGEITPTEQVKPPKIVDKLAGVYLKEGDKVWVKVHVEVEGTAKQIFGRRMFRYFSRIFDKHEPVISIAIFLEKRTKNNIPVYKYSGYGTKVEFTFNSIYIAELDEIELSKSSNPFAKILLIAKLAIQKGNSVQDLFDKKKAIARQLLILGLDDKKTRSLLNFLKAYLYFDSKEINNKFDAEIKLLTNKSETMGVTEQIIELFKQEAKEEGIQQGKISSMEEISKNLLKEGLDIKLIHKTTAMPLKRLKELQKTSLNT
ncbi:MAG: hypothetical protein J7497_01810 [Chitinophagaceae bacterium]|nr:hypothetical protein [Chitinophagaceae bacterium]